jgi:cytochrome c oxidase cbb3-type subunit 3
MNGRSRRDAADGRGVGSDDVENVAHYVLSLSGSTADPIKPCLGKPKFAACAACHGIADGTGNQALGAPNLTDKIWLYGGSAATVMETIRKGRNNTMPAFRGRLPRRSARCMCWRPMCGACPIPWPKRLTARTATPDP